jgi:hypothetical protein
LADWQEHNRAREHRQRNRKILTEDLDMRKVCAKMAPNELTEERKQRKVEICQDFDRQDDILGHVITGDEKCGSTNMTLKRSSQMHNGWVPILHEPKKSHQSKSKVQTILLNFFFILEGLFVMSLYQLDKQSSKFTISKYWKGCIKS